MRLSHLRTRSIRRGFTLVEVLVAAGLSMLIMLMVTTAFTQGMDTLSKLKSVGEMQQRLRGFEAVMRTDLEAEHFESRYGPKLSDQRLDLLVPGLTNDTAISWRPPTRGFFRIVNDEPSLPPIHATLQQCGMREGTSDMTGNLSTRAIDHMLHMTVHRNANRGDKLFHTKLPTSANMAAIAPSNMSQMATTPQTLTSDWAEVVYYLDLMDPTTGAIRTVGQTPGGTPLFGLYRRVRVLAGNGTPSSVFMTPMTTGTDRDLVQAVSNMPANMAAGQRPMNGPEEVRNPRARLGGLHSNRFVKSGDPMFVTNAWDTVSREESATNTPTGSDLLLTDVISFEVKADWDLPAVNPAAITSPMMTSGNTFEFPFNILPVIPGNRNPKLANRRIFDTWYDTPNNSWLPPATGSATGTEDTIPMPIRIRALQIKVRVWDRKNGMARQVTIIQDM